MAHFSYTCASNNKYRAGLFAMSNPYQIFRKLVKNYFPQSPPQVLKTEWDKELEELRAFVKQEEVRFRPSSLEQIVQMTRFNRKEVQLIYRGFKENCPSGMVTRASFKQIFHYLFVLGNPDNYADYVFETFDMDKNGIINFDEFVQGLSVIARGTDEEKIEWIFNLYDIAKNGRISWEELRKIILSISEMMGENAVPECTEISIHDHTEEIFYKLDIDGDGEISKDDFVKSCASDPTILQSFSVFKTILASKPMHDIS